MYIDWITWSIWLIGFLILVVWIWVPIKEIRAIMRKKRESMPQTNLRRG